MCVTYTTPSPIKNTDSSSRIPETTRAGQASASGLTDLITFHTRLSVRYSDARQATSGACQRVQGSGRHKREAECCRRGRMISTNLVFTEPLPYQVDWLLLTATTVS